MFCLQVLGSCLVSGLVLHMILTLFIAGCILEKDVCYMLQGVLKMQLKCELVGIYMLNVLSKNYNKSDFRICRDNRLALNCIQKR